MCIKLVALTTLIGAFTFGAIAQDDGELRIKKALEGRNVLVKMDLPAVDRGIEMVFDSTAISLDESNHKRLLKEYGTAVKKGSRARITAVRVSKRGLELDLDGGGSPVRDWFVGEFRLVEPAPVGKSDREVEIERVLSLESNNIAMIGALRNELELERSIRHAQDERNRQAFDRVSRMRSEYLDANRKNWGSKLIIVVRSRSESVTVRDMMRSLAKFVELLPREPASE